MSVLIGNLPEVNHTNTDRYRMHITALERLDLKSDKTNMWVL